VLELAAREARELKHIRIGTEHLLLALIREGGGVAARVLSNLGMTLDQTRKNVLAELDPNLGEQSRST
jgi:ATP-dependent Clp protease ATP-binding subunit ClpC